MPAAVPLMRPRPSHLSVLPSPDELEKLGRQMSADDVRKEFFPRRSLRWIKRHVAPKDRFYLGRDWTCYELHVRAWLPSFIQEQQQRANARGRKA